MRVTAKYDHVNPAAMKRLITAGTQLRAFPPAVMEASFKAANETYAELAKTNARFKKILNSFMAFRQDSYSWWQVAELSFDLFQVKMLGRS